MLKFCCFASYLQITLNWSSQLAVDLSFHLWAGHEAAFCSNPGATEHVLYCERLSSDAERRRTRHIQPGALSRCHMPYIAAAGVALYLVLYETARGPGGVRRSVRVTYI